MARFSLNPEAHPRVIGLAAALAGLIALLATACVDARKPGHSGRLHSCTSDEGPTDAWCGTMPVYEDRAAHAGRRIPLAIVILPALSDAAAPDPLFFLAGGPGQGAAKMAGAIGATFGRVQRRRDIVLVDQRGTGRSNPLNCPSDSDSLQAAFASDDAALQKLRECLAKLDADVRDYTTDIAMDDLDDVREYLGYDQIDLYGGSYGTRAALVYLRQHERHVRAVVLDGVAPTSMRLPLFAARDAERSLNRLLADCDTNAACRTAYPGLAARVRALLARLERAPVRARLVHPVTGAADTVDVSARAVASIVFGALYSPVTASMLPMLLDRAGHDDFQGLLALAFATDSSDNMSVGMQLSVLCSEDAPLITAADVSRETARSMFGVHLVASQLKACEIWPKAAVGADYYEPVTSNVPALILSGDIDPVTPASWGDLVARHLPRSRHLTAAATGHGVAMTPCGGRLVADFLEAGHANDLDTACLSAPRRPPFFLTPAGPDPIGPAARVSTAAP